MTPVWSNILSGHTFGRIQRIALMSRTEICYTTCHLETQTVAPTLLGFQVIKQCIQYLDSQHHKPIFHPSNYYDGSNVTIITWSGNKFEDYTTQNVLECHKDADNYMINNIRRSVLGIIHYLISVDV